MRECGKDNAKGMVSDIEGVRSLGREVMSKSIRDGICVCVVVVVVVVVVLLLVVVVLMVAMGGMVVVVLIAVVGIVVLVMVVRVAFTGVVGVVRVLCMGVLEVDCVGVIDALVLGAVFVVQVVEGVELVVGCVVRRVVRLVLWCVNERGYFLRCFSLKLVEMNGLSVGGLLFGMVIWGDCFILLEWGFLDKMVGADVLLDMVVVDIVVVETVDVVQVRVFYGVCLGDMMGVRVVIETVVGVVVLGGGGVLYCGNGCGSWWCRKQRRECGERWRRC